MIDLPDLLPGSVVALDTETSGLHPDDGARVAAVSIAWRTGDRIHADAFPFDQGVRDKLPVAQDSLFLTDDPNLGEAEWRELHRWLEDKRLVFHNAKFDLHMMRTGTRYWDGWELEGQYHWDTMVVQRVLDPAHPVGLDVTAKRLWGDTSKSDTGSQLAAALKRHKVKRYDLVPWDDIRDYAANDAELTLRLYEDQQVRIDEGEVPASWVRLELDLTRVLYLLEARGMQYDFAGSVEAAGLLTERADMIAATLPFHPTPNGAKDWFYTKGGHIPAKTTEKGNPQLDDEALAGLIRQSVPWAAEYQEVSKLRRAVSMWYQGYADALGPDGRLRTSYRQVRVVSGRMSVERVQLQAIPKYDKTFEGVPHIRELFGAAPGYALWNLDLSQAELRAAAHFANCTTMLEMLAGGADLHTITCEEVIGTSKGDPDFKRDRDIAKRLTFGGIFQIGAKTFQATLSKLAGIHLPLDECDRIVHGWRRRYPEFGTAYRRYERQVREHGYVLLYDGRPSYFGPRDYPNTGWNRKVQGSLAEFLKYWLVELERRYPGIAVLTVHDSVVLELPEEDQETAVEVAEWSGQFATEQLGCPMNVDVGPWHH